jgi:hypothetical protein
MRSKDCLSETQIEWVELVSRTGKITTPKKLAGTCTDGDKLGKVFRAPMKAGLLWGEGKFIVSGNSKATYFYKAAAGE